MKTLLELFKSLYAKNMNENFKLNTRNWEIKNNTKPNNFSGFKTWKIYDEYGGYEFMIVGSYRNVITRLKDIARQSGSKRFELID